jgi:bifunctional pyridoxal-dependent enzyme with beta-cystathionase and maltose regulon repressor activities
VQAIKDEEKAIAEIVHHLETDGDDVCCILLEPIQGEGGDNHFRPEFWQQLRQIANKYDVLLIADEVRTNVFLLHHSCFSICQDIYPIWCAYILSYYIYMCTSTSLLLVRGVMCR